MEVMVRNNEMVLGLINLFAMAMPEVDYSEWYPEFKKDTEPKKYIRNLINKAKDRTGFNSMNVMYDEEKELVQIHKIDGLFGKSIIHINTKRAVEFDNFTSMIMLASFEQYPIAFTKRENYNVESEEFEVICEGKDEIWEGLKKITGLDFYEIEDVFESATFTSGLENNMIVKIAGEEYVIDVL
ncbi:hypothetical protein CLSAP_06900 [Clostridium saccharoperbutylacetonicum]|nr:hypothetical protein CLSAP_06900 [Clostridium saccharoperbutylacetonicum]